MTHAMLQVMVVGDVHGQYFDLLNILKKWRPDHNLLFLGDYVGKFLCNIRCSEQLASSGCTPGMIRAAVPSQSLGVY